MGKKLDALLGKNFKASKFKTFVNLAISRIAFLERQHRVRCQQARQCPDKLKEAISSLIFAASRCGELEKIRRLFTSRYGKELERRAVELRNNCGVNPKKKMDADKQQKESEAKPQTSANLDNDKFDDANQDFKRKLDEKYSERKNAKKKYRDAECAAEAAYKFAADTAEAARAAVQLARPHQNDHNVPRSSSEETIVSDTDESSKFRHKTDHGSAIWKEKEKGNKGPDANQMNATGILNFKPGDGEIINNKNSSHHKEIEERYKMTELVKLLHGLSSESGSRSFIASLKCQENSSLERNSSSLQKIQADQVKHTEEEKSNAMNTYNKDSAEKSGLNRPRFGRKPLSVRTRR
ncbi:hypothetical protein REPUB_Repub12eG0010100 [Reevesia pubescens]